MHATTTCKILFSASYEKLEAATDYLDKLQCGEYFMDDDNESLVLVIEENMDMSSKEDVLNFITKLYKGLKRKVSVHALGTFNALGADLTQKFECQYNKNFFRYRETEWRSDLVIDEDLSYEEFEEENYVDVDEDEYEEYVHRAHEGISESDNDMYGDWEYID